MAFVFELPEIGEGVVEGEVVSWKVQVGDSVARDQPFCEIMTDKATVEISSPTGGTVLKLYGEPGDIIKVHEPLAEIDDAGAPASAAPAAAKAPAAPAAASRRGAAPSDPSARSHTKAAPAVRREARERGIDIHQVPGTGPRGRVTRDDLATHGVAGAPGPSSAPMPIAPPALPQVHPSGHVETVKIIGLRRKIAQQMLAAKQTAPHFTYVEEIDATELVALRKRLKPKAAARGIKLTFLPFILKACSVAFRDFPNVNATMNSDTYELSVHGDHNIGIATDTPQGLFVPVLKSVERKSILHLAVELAQLTDRTRNGTASRDDMSGGTFTITSVGNIGGVLATPILNIPEVAIMGVNAIRDRAVVVDGQIVVRKMMHLSPSFDHRIIDGAVAARFVARVKALLEDPAELLVELS
ncbi:MAG: dihydrolipoamide acetyltransferase family protein [Myxococcota bacterium]